MANEKAYNYLPVLTIDDQWITLQARNVVAHRCYQMGNKEYAKIWTNGGFVFECYNTHEDYCYESVCIELDDAFCHL